MSVGAAFSADDESAAGVAASRLDRSRRSGLKLVPSPNPGSNRAVEVLEALTAGDMTARCSVALGARPKASAEQIQEVIGSIAKIASQTKLPALNAANESARADEAGVGFGVVAQIVTDSTAAVREIACEAVQVAAQASSNIQEQAMRLNGMWSPDQEPGF